MCQEISPTIQRLLELNLEPESEAVSEGLHPLVPDHMATEESEAEVDAVLDQLLEWGARISPTTVEEHLHHERRLRRNREEAVSTVDWSTEYFPLANGKAFPSEEPNTHWRL
jgi:hypothetical protein